MSIHCLHIGINDYRGTENDLGGCVNDAMDSARTFGRRRKGAHRDAFDSCRFFGKCDSQLTLLDGDATRKRVLSELQGLLRKLERGDLAVITFSGHGTYVADRDGDESDGYDEAIVTAELNVILDDELCTLFERRVTGSRVLFASDSCHSGTNLRTIGHRLAGGANPNHRLRFVHPLTIPAEHRQACRLARMKAAAKLVDVIHFGACGDRQFAADAEFGGRANGAFTHYWLEALCGLPAGSTYGDWRDAVAKRLPNHEFEQIPTTNAYTRALNWKLPTA